MDENLFPIRVGGVPEHFNMPWHWAFQKGIFERDGIDLQWQDFAAGTGAMCKALENNELDVAVLLTEGAITAIENGNPSTILQFYVNSPLVWGVHVATKSTIKNIKEIVGKKFAISRLGSGSHLMAKVLANQEKFTISNEQFIAIENLKGATEALPNGKADVFLWEKFMTKPYVDKGVFKRIGEIPTPWSCFVIVVRNQFLEENKEAVLALIGCINEACAKFDELKNKSTLIAEKYNLQEKDVKDWLKSVEWNFEPIIENGVLEDIKAKLKKMGVIGS